MGDGLFRKKSLTGETTNAIIDNEIIKISKESLNNFSIYFKIIYRF